MPKKLSGEITDNPIANAAALARWLQMQATGEIVEPTSVDIQEWRAKLAGNDDFDGLSDANKNILFRVICTLRLKRQAYLRLVKFDNENAGPFIGALENFIAAFVNHPGLLTAAADEIEGGWETIKDLFKEAETLRDVVQRISAQGRVYDWRTVKSRMRRDEVLTIRNCLKFFGLSVPKTRPSDRQKKRTKSHGLDLMDRIIDCVNGRRSPSPVALRMRLLRAEKGHNS